MLSITRRLRKATVQPSTSQEPSKTSSTETLSLSSLVDVADFTGAITLLEFELANRAPDEPADKTKLHWLAYCYFHKGDYEKAQKLYEELGTSTGDPFYTLSNSLCWFYQGDFAQAKKEAKKAPKSRLRNRLLMHLAHRNDEEETLLKHHQQLENVPEDRLCLGSIHYLRGHYEEAFEVYNQYLGEQRDADAVRVYIALCRYKLEYHEVALEVLHQYLSRYPDSPSALNLKACCHYKMFDGKEAERILKRVQEQMSKDASVYGRNLVAHNMVVFEYGKDALHVLPQLVDIIPEAPLNLAVYYLREGQVEEAFRLLKDIQPITTQECLLQAVAFAAMGQKTNSLELLETAKELFKIVGGKKSERDTVPGRQAMTQFHFLEKDFSEVTRYLDSIKTYCCQDNAFNWNLGVAKGMCGEYMEAEEALHVCSDEKYQQEPQYLAWLARCYIRNGRARLAWDMYMKVEAGSSSQLLLQLIANECYATGDFYYSAKAFDVLERMYGDEDLEIWEGKRGACLGVFQKVVSGEEPMEALQDVAGMLQTSESPQAPYILRLMQEWAATNGQLLDK